MKALVPCHSPTSSKSTSKLSVIVYQGTSQPIRRLEALDVGLRRARGVRERRVTGVEVCDVGILVSHHRAADAAAYSGHPVTPGSKKNR